ncbi:helix-turn-helix domain-containing protein [Streptomyces orinoci]|uniref:Helix-turn-helix transcriptional regulator n=1 Tax=Streptomyces orinoci TaxID=67339 RepID=A0ABV3JUL7_STRON|nr:helix-turn-helix transcriptional regulator [Streptomyces orinoci]
MNWSDSALQAASAQGDYGRVIQLVRASVRMTQGQLGHACGLSQSAISRLEKRGTGEYNMTALARAAHHLGIPPRLVGLADTGAVPGQRRDGNDDVKRRNFLADVAVVAAAPAINAVTPPRPEWDGGQAAVLRLATTAYRRMDATVSARHLADTVAGHLRLVQTVATQAADQAARNRLAAVGSEAASLAGWLSWDMADQGSARTWYGAAIKAARRAGDPLLIAYQQGSLAQFEVEYGNCAQGIRLIRSARRQLGSSCPPIAAAWLSSLEAVAHATAGDERAADRALATSAAEVHQVSGTQAPPWPWVFTFDERKVAAARVTCGARLARPRWVLASVGDAASALSSSHEKQRALLQLDVANGHMAAGNLDTAFALATQALDTGLKLRSGRVAERARAFRRGYSSTTPPSIVRDFDSRLNDAYL